MKRVALAVLLLFCAVVVSAGDAPDVKLLRLPDGGVQPQVMVDKAGIVHAVVVVPPVRQDAIRGWRFASHEKGPL